MNSQILKQAFPYISNPDTWCRGERARNLAGDAVPVMSDDAVKFCSRGALYRVLGTESADLSDVERFFSMKGNVGNPLGLNYVGMNELRKHEVIVQMWSEAIRLAEKEEAEGGPKSSR